MELIKCTYTGCAKVSSPLFCNLGFDFDVFVKLPYSSTGSYCFEMTLPYVLVHSFQIHVYVISKDLIRTNLGYGVNKDFGSEINEARTFG